MTQTIDVNALAPETIDLARAMAIEDYGKRRSALRRICTAAIALAASHDASIDQLLVDAVTARNAARGTKAPATRSGFRDQLHESALLELARALLPQGQAGYHGASAGENAFLLLHQQAGAFQGADVGVTAHTTMRVGELKRQMDPIIEALRATNMLTHTTTENDVNETATMTTDAPATPAPALPIIELTAEHKGIASVLDTLLLNNGLPSLSDLVTRHNVALTDAFDLKEAIARTKAQADAEMDVLRRALATRTAAAPLAQAAVTTGARTIPSGNTVVRRAKDVFGMPKSKLLDFDITCWEWDAPHPDVPTLDGDYIFREKMLVKLLYAIEHNTNPWLHGHTGTGKTTLIEQVAARMGVPVCRVNFDSEVDRAALVGRETLTTEGEGEQRKTVTKFVDGALPTAMVGPYWFIADELDRIRPDIAYVFQRALEAKGMTVLEDGGRLVVPHPMFRIVATANTNGQVDESGLYSGARPQSAAFMNRFRTVIEVPYLDAKQERKLIQDACPAIPADVLDAIMNYVGEHRRAFNGGEVTMPLSPRATISLGEAFTFWRLLVDSDNKALAEAIDMTIFGLASSADRVVLSGLAQRVLVVKKA